jgi:hypothetical protein
MESEEIKAIDLMNSVYNGTFGGYTLKDTSKYPGQEIRNR